MSWTIERVTEQIQLGEDSSVEFKEAMFSGSRLRGPERGIIADELAAMGNSKGGSLIFSVSDRGSVQPMERGQMDVLEACIYEVCNDRIKPPLQFSTKRIALPQDSSVLVVEVEKSSFVHKSSGKYFHRQGSTKREMPPQILERLFAQRSRSGLVEPDERAVADTGPNTLDSALSQRFLSSRTGEPAESQFQRLGLVCEDADKVMRASVAGILLCTQNPETHMPGAFIEAVRYAGSTPDGARQLDAATITGPLDHQIKEAVAFAVRNTGVAAHKAPARVELPQYSERAIFEAIVNAVIHRDYTIRGSKIRLFIFDDRLELYSPGQLNNTLTLDSMRVRQSTRNEMLASLLWRIPVQGVLGSGDRQYFLERRGEGVWIIREETRKLTGIDPIYDLIDGEELQLTIPSAPQKTEGIRGEISVSADGKSLKEVYVLALYPNKTYQEAKTDSLGRAGFDFHSKLPMTVFCAMHGFTAHVESDWNPTGPLAIELKPLASGGSAIISEGNGHIPGLQGRLNPILDTLDRTYLYANNIAIDGGKQQPVHFSMRKLVHLTDVNGTERIVRFIEMIGKATLLEYETPTS